MSSKKNDISLAPEFHCSIKHKVQRIMHIFICMCYHPFALSSPNRWSCLCCLSDGTHHQLYESPLLLIHQTWQHRSRDRSTAEWVTTQSSTSWEEVQTWCLCDKKWELPKVYTVFILRCIVCTDSESNPLTNEWSSDCLSYVHLSFCSPASCSRNVVIVSQSLSSDPATPHRLSTRYAPCSWNCQENEWADLDLFEVSSTSVLQLLQWPLFILPTNVWHAKTII